MIESTNKKGWFLPAFLLSDKNKIKFQSATISNIKIQEIRK
jgi:hypothetical protein